MESSVHPSVDFFLGATTPAGFKGYFAPLRREPGMQLVLLKSGPGCGKSTLMKRLARAAQDKGEPIQRIHCASDPDSLDGVVFLRQKRAIIDATAPHVVEPEAPGADERVLSLYHTIDADALHPHKDEVTALFARNQLLRSRAARYVASAGSLLLDSRRAEACSANFEKVRRYVKRLCTRLLPRTEEMGSEELRLLSAITPKGEVFYQGTGAVVSGPVPLPTHKQIFTVNRSTFVNKKAREQFQLCTFKRILDIYSSTPKTIDALMKLELPSGVEVEIKV